MAAKFDKEMMKKQHFWLLLIPLFIGLLLAWIGLFFGVANATDEQAKANDDEKKKVESAKAQPKKTLDLYDVRKGELFELRTKALAGDVGPPAGHLQLAQFARRGPDRQGQGLEVRGGHPRLELPE